MVAKHQRCENKPQNEQAVGWLTLENIMNYAKLFDNLKWYQ